MSQAEEPVATVHNSTSTSLYKKDSYKMLQSKSWIRSVAETLPRHAHLSDHTAPPYSDPKMLKQE